MGVAQPAPSVAEGQCHHALIIPDFGLYPGRPSGEGLEIVHGHLADQAGKWFRVHLRGCQIGDAAILVEICFPRVSSTLVANEVHRKKKPV